MQNKRLNLSFKKLLISQFGEFKLFYILGIFCIVITHKIQSDLPFLAKELADKIALNINELHPSKFFFLALGIIVFRTTSRILFFYPARQLQKFLRSELIEELETKSPLRFRHLSSGQLFQYLTGDIDQIRALIGFVGLQGGNFIIAMFILIPRLMSFSPKLLLALIPLIITFVIFTLIVSKNGRFFKQTQDMQGEVQNLIIESYIGKRTIKNFHAEDTFTTLFSELTSKELYYFYRASLGISFSLPLITFGIGLSLLWGALIIKNLQMPSTALILFSGFIFLFMEPLSYLSWIGVVISRSSASWQRLTELNSILISPKENECQLHELNPETDSFDNLELKIPFWKSIINLKLISNKWNVFVAKTGHGKSELLFKLAEVLRSKGLSVSLVAQDPYIYNDTIEKNIFLGKNPSTLELESAKSVLKILGLDYLEPNLDKLLALEVGENGKRLSGGQIKRLALVRSIMSSASVIIWDDPFSSVDLILEKEIISELKKQKVLLDKTILLSSHRLSTVRNSDQLFFLDKNLGMIESGDIDSLLREDTKTYEYFKQQMV
jgi:ABC-type multidrug transport system fused ATPase/permease subunit